MAGRWPRDQPRKTEARPDRAPRQDITHATRIILANPIFQAFRKQGALPAIHTLNKALHPIPPQIAQESYRENHINARVFTQPGSEAEIKLGHYQIDA